MRHERRFESCFFEEKGICLLLKFFSVVAVVVVNVFSVVVVVNVVVIVVIFTKLLNLFCLKVSCCE